jgi:Cu-Zn family superoxide dismutase
MARADLRATDGNMVTGIVEFLAAADGALTITAEIAQLSPGDHGFHIHERGDCSAPDAASAGEHFAPEGHPHGPPTASREQRHLGDLGNIVANEEGVAIAQIKASELTLTETDGIIGRAIVVHASADDLRSQPAGNSGEPVACGVIKLVSHQPQSTPFGQ